MDTDQQLRGGSVMNYKSVQEQPEDAAVELERYREKGYVKDLSEEQLKTEFPGGTISRMGLIVKPKEGGGIKRRFIVDLRRSTGNSKAKLPERLILPRPLDAVSSMRSLVEKGYGKKEEERDMELALVDISDAFMSLAVHPEEWKHCVAPSLKAGEYVIFVAMLFGFKTAPLLWSRVAALVSRLLLQVPIWGLGVSFKPQAKKNTPGRFFLVRKAHGRFFAENLGKKSPRAFLCRKPIYSSECRLRACSPAPYRVRNVF